MGFLDVVSYIADPLDLAGYRGDKQNTKTANEALDKSLAKAEEAASQNKGLYKEYIDRVRNAYGGEASNFSNRVKELEGVSPYDAGEFNYNGSIEDFYSKAANQRIANAMDAITNSRANAGNMFSSDYTNALAAKQQALASEEWDKAYDRYMQDRARALQEFSTNANLGQQAYMNTYNKNKDLLGVSQNAQDNLLNAYGAYTQGQASNNAMLAQNYANVNQAKASNNIANNRGLISRIFGSFIFGILSLGPIFTNLI